MSNYNRKLRGHLYEIAASLNRIHFPDDTGLAEEFFDKDASGCGWHYIVRPSRTRKLWTVRLFLGGKLRCIGATERGEDAARFADMAVMRFVKYRLRPTTAESIKLNNDAAQVAEDTANVPEAVELLNQLEQYFLDAEVIAEPQPEQKVSRQSRGLRSDIMVLHEELMNAIAELTRRVEQLNRPVVTPMYYPPSLPASPAPPGTIWCGDPHIDPHFTCIGTTSNSPVDNGTQAK